VTVLQGRNITTVFDDSFYRVVLGGMAEVAHSRGYSLVFTPPPADGAGEAEVSRVLGHGAVDGALVVGALDAGYLMGLRHRGLPVVLVDNHVPGRTSPRWCPTTGQGPGSRPPTSSASAIGGLRCSARR
jgi:DNA-binding LacI/PurR family transcriptional regulator